MEITKYLMHCDHWGENGSKKMNLLFISYWGIEEGLTKASVIPHVKILSSYDEITKIFLVSIERESKVHPVFISEKIHHLPIMSKSGSLKILGLAFDFIRIPEILKTLCREKGIEKILARGTLAGTMAYKVSKMTNIPFYMESFEPHADYMKETGVWRKSGIKYKQQKRWELDQINNASGIMTVTDGYTNLLTDQFASLRNILTVPCAVDPDKFKFSALDRADIRKQLNINPKKVMGVYLGKFGGLYLDINELKFLNDVFRYFEDFGLMILTPDPEDHVRVSFDSINLTDEKIVIRKVLHDDVPKFLSAADFGLSLNKRFPSGKYLSPIKIGEYWANGLPVLMTEGIGDERNFLEKEKGGVIFNENNLTSSLKKLKKILDDPNHRKRIPELARKYRSFETVRKAYEKMIISPEL